MAFVFCVVGVGDNVRWPADAVLSQASWLWLHWLSSHAVKSAVSACIVGAAVK
jgi:hypothetical protein